MEEELKVGAELLGPSSYSFTGTTVFCSPAGWLEGQGPVPGEGE